MYRAADSQDALNKRIYHAPGVDTRYKSWELNRCEAVTLLKHQSAFAGRDVLDLGVGTGRTTIYLAPLARSYHAIDYSPVMVARAKANLPGISVRLGDLRDLSAFADSSLDMVFASNNVYDAVSHEDRARAFAEAHRVLRDGGHLLFSSHNRSYRDALSGPKLETSANPVRQAVHLVRWIRSLANARRIRHMHRAEADYSLLSDEGHAYSALHYYIDHTVQRRRLRALGFRVVEVLDTLGQSRAEADPSIDSPWLMYVARREAS